MTTPPTRANASTPTTARGRARRDQLINVALSAFAAHGFRGASLAAIAQEVGISEPGLLHHFPSKKDLLLGVLEFHERRVLDRIAEVADAGGSFGEQLLAIVRGHEADPAFIRLFTVLAAETVDPAHPAHDWFVDRYRRVRGHFREHVIADQREGRLRGDADPDQLARLMVAVLDGLELQFLLEPTEAGISSPLAMLLDVLER